MSSSGRAAFSKSRCFLTTNAQISSSEGTPGWNNGKHHRSLKYRDPNTQLNYACADGITYCIFCCYCIHHTQRSAWCWGRRPLRVLTEGRAKLTHSQAHLLLLLLRLPFCDVTFWFRILQLPEAKQFDGEELLCNIQWSISQSFGKLTSTMLFRQLHGRSLEHAMPS